MMLGTTNIKLKLLILVKRSTYFGRPFRPSSGAQHCTYGNRHMCSVELVMMDGKTETCRAFYKNKYFEKYVHLLGCIIRIYYDARTYIRQIYSVNLNVYIAKHRSLYYL